MSCKLQRKDNTAVIHLPPSLFWIDEFDWSDLAQSSPQYTLGGSVVVQQGAKLAGRPITLEIDKHEVMTRANYKELQAWSAAANLQMTYTHADGRTFNVAFRNHENAIECEPLFHQIPAADGDLFAGKIKLMTM